MRSFAAKRHRRRSVGTRERLRKQWRRAASAMQGAWTWTRRWFLAVLAGVFALVIGVMLFSPILHVREIRVQRVQGRTDVAAIQKSLAPLFGKHLLFLSSFDVEDRVRAAVPDIAEVDVGKHLPSRLFVRVTVRPLIARVTLVEPAGAKPVAASGSLASTGTGAVTAPVVEKKEYLADNGIYVATTSAESGSVLPLIRVVDWGVRPAPGTQLLTEEFLTRMDEIERILTQEFGHVITQRTVYLRAQEFHLAVGSVSLWFDMQGTIEEQLTRYRMFLKTVGFKNITRYVDLRLKGRVVYR